MLSVSIIAKDMIGQEISRKNFIEWLKKDCDSIEDPDENRKWTERHEMGTLAVEGD